MKATYVCWNRGNLAIQMEIWTVPMLVAKLLMDHFKATGEARPGSYWEANFAKPYRRAIRAKTETVQIRTAGFTTGKFANLLALVGCETECSGDRN